MNLWVKALKLTLLSVLVLFFVSCDEELKNVGKNNSGSQFDLLFEEFVLPSHVIIDSLSTSRQDLLVGEYTDPELGVVTSEAYSSFFGLSDIDLNGGNIVFDSLVLSLKLTPYYYGLKSDNQITVKVHKLTEEIINLTEKTNFSSNAHDLNSIGEANFTHIAQKYDTLESDETDTLRIKLDNSYFQEIQNAITANVDSAVIKLPLSFYGFVIKASDGDKVIGINEGSLGTNLTIHYHTFSGGSTQDTLEYSYFFNQQGYNNITSDRSGTAIAGITDDNPSMPFEPSNNKRYMQSGTGITTEVDFAPFINFFSDKEHMIINSAQISVGDIESTIQYLGPANLSLLNTDEDSEVSSLEILGTDFPTIQSDFGTQLIIPYQADDNNSGVYNGLPSKYFQLLYDTKIERSTAVLQPFEISENTIVTEVGYTVDRFIVDKDSIKLKVYYTLPK